LANAQAKAMSALSQPRTVARRGRFESTL